MKLGVFMEIDSFVQLSESTISFDVEVTADDLTPEPPKDASDTDNASIKNRQPGLR